MRSWNVPTEYHMWVLEFVNNKNHKSYDSREIKTEKPINSVAGAAELYYLARDFVRDIAGQPYNKEKALNKPPTHLSKRYYWPAP